MRNFRRQISVLLAFLFLLQSCASRSFQDSGRSGTQIESVKENEEQPLFDHEWLKVDLDVKTQVACDKANGRMLKLAVLRGVMQAGIALAGTICPMFMLGGIVAAPFVATDVAGTLQYGTEWSAVKQSAPQEVESIRKFYSSFVDPIAGTLVVLSLIFGNRVIVNPLTQNSLRKLRKEVGDVLKNFDASVYADRHLYLATWFNHAEPVFMPVPEEEFVRQTGSNEKFETVLAFFQNDGTVSKSSSKASWLKQLCVVKLFGVENSCLESKSLSV